MIKEPEIRYDLFYNGWSKNNMQSFKQNLSTKRAVNEKFLAKGTSYVKLSCFAKRPS